MKIHEYQAKLIVLSEFGLPVLKGKAIFSINELSQATDEIGFPCVIKAQIHAGARGKAGGVKIANNYDEAEKIVLTMLNKVLVTQQTGPEGQEVRCIYIEQATNIIHEYYLSLVVDRTKNCLAFMASAAGGMDIEEVSCTQPDKIITMYIDPAIGIQPFYCRRLGYDLGLNNQQVRKLTPILQGIYKAFITTDAEQIEINPLIEDDCGEFYLLDAKMSFDNNALYRQKEILSLRDLHEEEEQEIEAAKYGLSYIKMSEGTIGCMVNGAGLAMATMDIIKYYGAEPANFLDVGGSAELAAVTQAFKIILADQRVKAILVNIFGGIMRCDIIAQGIVAAAKEVLLKVPLVVRLSGTNFALGKEILQNSSLNITSASTLQEAAQKVVSLARGAV